MKDGIVVEYDGMRFVFVDGESPNDCKDCIADKWCKAGSPANALCEAHEQGLSNEEYHCTSCTPIVEEAKVYSSINHVKAEHLVGSLVEFTDDGERWFRSTLGEIGSSASYFLADKDGDYYEYIREIPTRRLTWVELQAKYPDKLGDVELVEEVTSDE